MSKVSFLIDKMVVGVAGGILRAILFDTFTLHLETFEITCLADKHQWALKIASLCQDF